MGTDRSFSGSPDQLFENYEVASESNYSIETGRGEEFERGNSIQDTDDLDSLHLEPSGDFHSDSETRPREDSQYTVLDENPRPFSLHTRHTEHHTELGM